jgi:MFS family permease
LENRTRAWLIFISGNLGFILSMFYRVSPSVIAPQLSADLGLDPAHLGDVTAAFFYGFAACQLPLGLALDRLGIRWPMAALSLLGAAGAAWFASAQGLGGALGARALLGVGMSCGLMGPFALFAAWFPPRMFATIAGFHVAGGAMGQMLAATPLALMAETLGWRGSFWVFAAVNLLQAVAVALVVRDRPDGAPAPPRLAENPLKGLGRLLRMPAYWGISLATFFRFGCLMSLQGLWAGPYIIYGLGRSAVEAGNALLFLSVAYMISLPLSGRASDSWLGSRKWTVIPGLFAFSGLILCLALFPADVGIGWVYAAFALVGVVNGSGQIMYAHIKELVPRRYTATGMTGVNLFTMLGPAAMMQITGLMVAAEPSGLGGPAAFQPTWWLMVACLAAAGAAYTLLPDSRALDQEAAK